jgi:predicted Zn-dependent peptidase
MYDQYKGVLILYAGIDAKDHDLVVAEIDDIIHNIQTKQLSDQALIIAKKALIQNLVESLDSIGAITSRINHLAMFDRTFDQAKLIELVEQTTMDDIANIASMMTLDTSYLLRGESHE